MPIAKLTVELSIPHAQSIKDRRQVLRSLKDKLRHGFNVSIAELDDANLWNRATLGIAAISSSTSYLTGQMRELDNALPPPHQHPRRRNPRLLRRIARLDLATGAWYLVPALCYP